MTNQEINIVALEFPESVRTRTGMYLGATDNPDVCLREIIDNAVDELMGSTSCDRVDIQIKSGQQGGWYIVADNGRGIPIIIDEDRGITKTELAMTVINAGSKFYGNNVSIGTNGTGASAVNACCTRFVILSKITEANARLSIPDVEALYNQAAGACEIFYVLEFAKGIKVQETAMRKQDIESHFGFQFLDGMSTIVAFIPDPEIWTSISANYNKRSLSYSHLILKKFYQKTSIITIDGKEVKDSYDPYQFEFIKEIEVQDRNGKLKQAKFYINFDIDTNLSITESSGSINSLIVDRGLHIDWTKKSFMEALRFHYNIQHDYLYPGLKYNVICMTANMDFSSQTKERVVKIDGLYIDEVLPELVCEFHNIFHKNEDYFKAHVDRLKEYADALTQISAIQKVKAVVGTVEGGNRVRSKLPSSVKDAASNDRDLCELFIVEGKSASGTMLKSRNPEYHAILELRGVPMNAVNADLDTIMDNEEMNGIVTAIGAGVNEYFNIQSCRYGKVILSADSDIDGERINSMILGFIARKMTFLIEDGRVFIALAPLYHQGNIYVYPGEDPSTKIDMTKPFRRYKGLGEINTSEAKEFFFDENKRNLIKITPANLDYVFELLTTSSKRKELMIRAGIVLDKYKTGII